jgi:superfamily II DNA/RNA helicase
MARSGDDHVHRIGRTGRAGETGLAISLIVPQEWNVMSSIERYLGVKFEQRKIKGMEARFQGPAKKTKKADKKPVKTKAKEVPKAEQRHSFKKNIGKRRKPSERVVSTETSAGVSETSSAMAPPKRKPANKPEAKRDAPAKISAGTSGVAAGMAPLKRKPVSK